MNFATYFAKHLARIAKLIRTNRDPRIWWIFGECNGDVVAKA